MLRALLRLALISISAVIVVFLGLFFMRMVGHRQVFQPPPHAWFDKPSWKIYRPDAASACSPEAPSDWIINIRVRRKDHEWLVDCAAPKALSEVLSRSKHIDWLLSVDGNETSDLDKFVDIVEQHDREKAFAVHARSQTLARYLRKKSPQWIYAADTASLLRLHLFSSLWLETAMDFWPDFVIAGVADKASGSLIGVREAEELKRRHKRIVWEASTDSETPLVPVQGLLTNRIP